MHTCTERHTCKYTGAHIHTRDTQKCIHTVSQTHSELHTDTHKPIDTHTHRHTKAHAVIAHTETCTRIHMQTYAHIPMHTETRRDIQSHAQTHIDTCRHTPSSLLGRGTGVCRLVGALGSAVPGGMMMM